MWKKDTGIVLSVLCCLQSAEYTETTSWEVLFFTVRAPYLPWAALQKKAVIANIVHRAHVRQLTILRPNLVLTVARCSSRTTAKCLEPTVLPSEPSTKHLQCEVLSWISLLMGGNIQDMEGCKHFYNV